MYVVQVQSNEILNYADDEHYTYSDENEATAQFGERIGALYARLFKDESLLGIAVLTEVKSDRTAVIFHQFGDPIAEVSILGF